ncbi:MAG: MoaD/ThiS family protein [Deltaproteobacteria bacterium]|nr:MoaD/ThiS family protein [Deltaproteobacteria bacterium]
MTVKVHLPRILSNLLKGNIDLEVEGETVRDCLKQAVEGKPRLMHELFFGTSGDTLTETAKLRSVVTVKINTREVSSKILEAAVRDGDNLEIKLHLG